MDGLTYTKATMYLDVNRVQFNMMAGLALGQNPWVLQEAQDHIQWQTWKLPANQVH